MNNKAKIERDEISKYSKFVGVRFNPHLLNMINSKAKQEESTPSDIIREACMEYFDRNYTNTEMMLQQLQELSKKISYQDDKIEIYGMLLLNLVREWYTLFKYNGREDDNKVLLDRDIKAFEEQAAKSLKNHPGILSQMVLNIYEKEGAKDGE